MFERKKKVAAKESPEYRVGRAMLAQIMAERGIDAESAAAVYGEEGLPDTDELVAARAAAELTALVEVKDASGENGKEFVDKLLSDARFVELIRSMPLRLALDVYSRYVLTSPEANDVDKGNAGNSVTANGVAANSVATSSNAENSGRDINALLAAAREEGARDVLEKLKLNASAMKPLRGESASPSGMERDFTRMSSEEFNAFKNKLRYGR